MSAKSSDVEGRILNALPFASQWERQSLLFELGNVGGERALTELLPLADGSTKVSADVRGTALQALGVHRAGGDHLAIYERALDDRNLFVQCIAVALLRQHDQNGATASSVAAWLRRRLKGRTARAVKDYHELPLAVGYFEGIDDLPTLAILLDQYEDQLGAVERLVLEYMWPRAARREWASGSGEQRPDLTDLGTFGHPMQFYLRFDAQIAGIEEPLLPPEPTAEQEEQEAREWIAERDAMLEKLLLKRQRLITNG